MTQYRVYYSKSDNFHRFATGGEVPDKNKLKETHVMLKTIIADGLDDVFHQMQGEIWSPNGEARELIQMKGLSHTSMSVGDVLEDIKEGKFFVCAPVSWKEI